MKHIMRAGWAAQGEINIRSPQPCSPADGTAGAPPRPHKSPHSPRDESKLEMNALQGLTAAQRGMLRGMWHWGDSAGTVNIPSQTGKGAAATGTVCGHSDQAMSRLGAPQIQAAGKDLQVLLHGEWLGVRAGGHPVVPGTAVSVASPRRAGGGTVSRWDRRRGAIAAWHDN